MIDREGEPYVVAIIPDLEPTSRLDRCVELLARICADVRAAADAIRGRLGLWLCLPEAFASTETSLFQVAIGRELGRTDLAVQVVARGHASGLLALHRARAQVESGNLDAAILLGVDSYIDPDVLEALDQGGELMSDANKFGFPPGEAAAALLVAADGTLRNAGLPILGRVVDVGIGIEPEPMGSQGVSTGRGLAAAIDGATKQFSPQVPVGRIYSDQNGQRYRDSDYVWATQRVRPVFEEFSDFVTPAEAWGDVGAATGLLLVGFSLALAPHLRQRSPATLVYACSVGADRAAVTLHHDSIAWAP
ncbi:MAG: beta-ketoacyl synthase N-terminal-like domain-containing protein [Myxococcota bacterium]